MRPEWRCPTIFSCLCLRQRQNKNVLLRWCLIFLAGIADLHAQPTASQIVADAADFHKFRLDVLGRASRINSKSDDGIKYITAECKKKAQATSPEYLYGVFQDLAKDQSRTEDPYILGECLVIQYPPKAAIRVLRELQKLPDANRSEIQAWIEEHPKKKPKKASLSKSKPSAR